MNKAFTNVATAAVLFLSVSGFAAASAVASVVMPRAKTAYSVSTKGLPGVMKPVEIGLTVPGSPRLTAEAGAGHLPELMGNVLYPPASQAYLTMSKLPDAGRGNLRFDPVSPTGLTANGGGVLVDGVYWCGMIMQFEGFDYYSVCSYDATTWEQLSYTEASPELMATDMAVDPTDGKIYGCFYGTDGVGAVFGTIDYRTQIRREICPLESSWSGCAIDADGNLYAIDMKGILWNVNKTTGGMTEVGNTGLKPVYLTSACFDLHTGKLYYSYSPADETGWLYEIDPDTAAATPVYQFPGDEEVVGMYIAPARADYSAPGAPTGLVASFSGNSLSGTVSFCAPAYTYGGEPLAGELSYKVSANGSLLAQGSVEAGSDATADVNVAGNGLYDFTVVLENNVGSGPAESVRLYVGNDVPTAPKVSAVNSGGEITVSWEAVTNGVNNGFLDTSAVTYTVTRLNDASVVAEGLTGLSVTDNMEQPEELVLIKYGVTAHCHGMASEPGISNQIAAGPYLPPYREDFQNQDSFGSFTVIDANNDGNKWYHFYGIDNNGRARIKYNTAKEMDDWLITPAMRLEGGKVYMLHFDVAKEGGAVNIERIEVKYGQGNSVEAMTSTALTPTDVTDNNLTTLTCRIEPPTGGIYHIGFHGCSPKDRFWLHLDNIDLEAGAIPGAPDAVSNLDVTPGSYGRHQADIAFNVPATTFEGNALTEITKAEIHRNGAVIYTVEHPDPGQLVFYTDMEAEGGMTTYTALAYNAAGAGKPASKTVFIGTKQPQACKAVAVRETGNQGEVRISWTAPDRDVENGVINPAMLTYGLYALDNNQLVEVAAGISGTGHVHAAVEEDTQRFVQYCVKAVSEGGESELAVSEPIPAGKPSALPYVESFTMEHPDNLLCVMPETGNGTWTLLTDSSIGGITSADVDDAYAAFTGKAADDRASLLTGKVDLREAIKPMLTTKVFNMTGSEPNTNPIEIYVNDGNGYTQLISKTLAETGTPNDWNALLADLSPFNGKEVWLKFASQIDNYVYTMLDAVKVEETDPSAIVMTGMLRVAAFGGRGYIHVSGADGERVDVFTADGKRVSTIPSASGLEAIPAERGIYIVASGINSFKVTVK